MVKHRSLEKNITPLAEGQLPPGCKATADSMRKTKEEYGEVVICPNCGAEMVGERNFCHGCGRRLRDNLKPFSEHNECGW